MPKLMHRHRQNHTHAHARAYVHVMDRCGGGPGSPCGGGAGGWWEGAGPGERADKRGEEVHATVRGEGGGRRPHTTFTYNLVVQSSLK